jgi:hypothetical protein
MSSLNATQFGYHGTGADLKKGDIIEPGAGRQVWDRLGSSEHSYYEAPVVPSDTTPEEYGNPRRMARDMASGWADSASQKLGGDPKVYFVQAHGQSEEDPNVGGSARRAPKLEVLRRAPFNPNYAGD